MRRATVVVQEQHRIVQYRFQQGIPRINCSRFLGYDKDKKGRLVINDAQAAVVRRVYRDFLDGFSLDMIASDLRREGVVSGGGTTTWHTSSVRYLLTKLRTTDFIRCTR